MPYLGLAIFLIYYSVYHVNNRLITETLSFVITETAGGVVCFDLFGKCIYANDVAFSLYKDAKKLSDFEKIFSKYGYGKTQKNNKWLEEFLVDNQKQYFEMNYAQLEGHKYVEVDDFGSGYSSLNILKDMRANVLKIDMGFLRKTKEIERSKTIIDSVIKMAKQLNMSVVSEGVEEEEQIVFLTEAGCDFFQGYYFDRPISVEEFEKKY